MTFVAAILRGCPSEWIIYQDRCYKRSNVSGSWYEVRTDCGEAGADLASTDSFIIHIRDQSSPIITFPENSRLLWIGAYRRPWLWYGGRLFSYFEDMLV